MRLTEACRWKKCVNQDKKSKESSPAADVAGGDFADDKKLRTGEPPDAQFFKSVTSLQFPHGGFNVGSNLRMVAVLAFSKTSRIKSISGSCCTRRLRNSTCERRDTQAFSGVTSSANCQRTSNPYELVRTGKVLMARGDQPT
jgi:hypothetical protein